MNALLKVSLAVAAAAATSFSAASVANAGGLYSGGSMKDAPMVRPSSVSRCYLRGDVGYSYNEDASASFDSPIYGEVGAHGNFVDGAWMGEIGVGCGSGSRGFRADLTLGYRSEHDINGTKPDIPGTHFPAHYESKISTLTAMANVYYDFGKFRSFVPYVGAGIGIARHHLSTVHMDNPRGNPLNDLNGTTDTNFAWSLMAGAAYQISDRAVLDFGYRYIDMGDISTPRGDLCRTCHVGGSNDRLNIEDLHAHEFKIGLRYHFGGSRRAHYK